MVILLSGVVGLGECVWGNVFVSGTVIAERLYSFGLRLVFFSFPKQLGLEPAHGVCISGFNSVEWFVANFGAIFAG